MPCQKPVSANATTQLINIHPKCRVDGNGHRNDPMAGHLRAEPRCGNQQHADADPVDGAGLPDEAQQCAGPLWLDTRSGKHSELGDDTVRERDKDGQHTRGLKC